MKIKCSMNILLPTIQYGNTNIYFEAEVDTSCESDITDLNHIASTQSLKVKNISDRSEVLRNYVEEEVMSMKKSLEMYAISDFKLKV